jgi:hypothetical protein
MSERDPTGRDPHDPGAKLDQGKNRVGLVLGDFSNALWAVSEVGTYGAKKYSDHGWKAVPDGVERYLDAHLRHLLQHMGGEEIDPGTGMSHLAHCCWNVLAMLELSKERK